MAEQVQENIRQMTTEITIWFFAAKLVATIMAQILIRGLEMPLLLAFFLANTLIFLLAYCYFPRPGWNSRLYFTIFAFGMVGAPLVAEIVPPYLETFMPTLPAYGLPIILWGTLLYFTLRSFKSHNNALKNS
jgi:hypothetical protein